jgi:hypothetical protein
MEKSKNSTKLETKWFIQFNGQVQGPYNQDTLQSTLQGLSDDHLLHTLVWKKGLSEWVRASSLDSSDLDHDIQSLTPFSEAVTSLDGTEMSDTSSQITEGVFYRVQINFVDQPLMTKTELLQLISKQQDVTKVSIQDPHSKEWKEVYAFPDIVERLGLSRRKQSRVPILAQFSGKLNSQAEVVNYRVITISEGGMGFTENFELKIGDSVEGQISSPHLFQSLPVRAEVIYAGPDGYIGLKFTQITDESKSAVIEYIKKFGKNPNPM